MTIAKDSAVPRLGRRACLLLFLLALAARLAAIAAVGFTTVGFGDARAYLGAAKALARTGHYPLRTDAFFFRPPGYPVFLAAVTLADPDRVALAKLAGAVAGSLAALLFAALSARIFRDRAAALATGAAAAVHPAFLLVGSDIQSESLFLPLLLAAGYLLLASTDRPSSSLAAAAGIALGAAALTRASALALAPLLGAALFDRRYPTRARAHLAAAALAGFLFALAPWTLRNALVFRRFIPVSDMAGSVFYDGNSDWTRRFYELASRQEYERWIAAMDRDKRDRIAALAKTDPAEAAHPSEYFGKLAAAERLADPAGTLALSALKARDWLRPYPSPWFWPAWIVASVGVFYTGLFALAALELATAARRGVVHFSLVFLALTMAVHVATLVVWRYRVPYWDPVLLLFGVFGGLRAARRWRLPGRVAAPGRPAGA